MKILFADSVDESRLEQLTSHGHECVVNPSLDADSIPGEMAGVDILVVRSTKVTADSIAASSQLSLVVRAGAGTDNIDKSAASGAGVYVCNVPGRNAVAVAELTMGLLLAIDRRIADNTADLRAGVWNKGIYSVADGIQGKSLGIVGLGDIGLAVAERAKAFGMTVSTVRKDGRSPSVQAMIRSIGIRLVDSQDQLLAESDVVSIHVPKSPDTTGLVNKAFLDKMADGAILLNTSRGEVVDEVALLEALNTRGLRAGLDVYANEPSGKSTKWASELAQHPGVVGTHHIGASTNQAQEAVADGTVETILAYLGGDIRNCVNLATVPTGPVIITIRHHDKVGVLAQIFQTIRSNGINVQQMSNQVFAGGGAAVATMTLASDPADSLVDELNHITEVIAVTKTPAGS